MLVKVSPVSVAAQQVKQLAEATHTVHTVASTAHTAVQPGQRHTMLARGLCSLLVAGKALILHVLHPLHLMQHAEPVPQALKRHDQGLNPSPHRLCNP